MSRQSSRSVAALLLATALIAGAPGRALAADIAGKSTQPPVAVNPAAPAVPAASAPAAVPAPVVAPGGVLVPGSEFRYDSTGRRDPFKSLLQLEKKQRDVTSLPPIQQFDLESVKVVGVVVDRVRGTQAMVKTPNNMTFVVKVGTVMGKNEGEVVEITLQGIRVIEKYLDFMNRETRKETFLKSHPTAGK
jgi:type IV pilus assembly protein PilP